MRASRLYICGIADKVQRFLETIILLAAVFYSFCLG